MVFSGYFQNVHHEGNEVIACHQAEEPNLPTVMFSGTKVCGWYCMTHLIWCLQVLFTCYLILQSDLLCIFQLCNMIWLIGVEKLKDVLVQLLCEVYHTIARDLPPVSTIA